MPGSTQGPSQQTNQTQQTQTSPWAPAIPLLQNLLNQTGAVGTGVTPEQSAATQALIQQSGQVPSYAGQATGAVNQLFGANTLPQQGILSDAYKKLQASTAGLTDPNNLNPMNTPGFAPALATQTQDITNQIKSMFAASGRALSPDEAQAIARGVLQGTSPTIASQYGANVSNLLNAANSQFAAGGSTAGGITAQQSQQLQDQINALSATGMIPGILTQPATTQLGAANTAFGLPYSNIGTAENLVNPIAGLGSSSVGSGTSTTTSQQPLLNTIISGLGLGLGTFGALKSDVRAKTDLQPVGLLFDTTPVYKFRYKSDPTRTTHIGLLAQDVERYAPEAVLQDETGTKYVDYGLATLPAANRVAA
jgi:hypothetical protein